MGLDHSLEELMGQLGDFGRYQGFQFFLHLLSALTAGMHMLSLVTVGAIPEHRCFIPGVDTDDLPAPWNSTGILSAIPINADGGLDSCRMYSGNITVSCNKYVYDKTYYQTTRATEWNFVCDDRWMIAIAQSAYMMGTFFGAVTLGGLADKIGRKTVFCWSAVLQLIFGVLAALIPGYIPFLIVRFIYGIFGSAGCYIPGFVLTMELVGTSKRTACGISFQAAFAGGIMLVAVWGAIIPDPKWLQVVYGLHSCLLLVHWWVMDESPRWLWMQGKREEAIKIISKGIRWNTNTTLDEEYYLAKTKSGSKANLDEEPSGAGISDLFKTKNLRMKTLNVCFCWFANAIAYYGLSLSSGKLSGNPYLILFIMGLVELPSYLALAFVLDILGRRSITSTLMLIGGVCCIVAAYMEQGSVLSTAIVFAGKFTIAGSFAVIYNYSAELFPTIVRNTGMGLGSMAARLAGASTPLITLLDSFDPKIPAVSFGVIAILSGFWVCFLPETNKQTLPQSISDGEAFGIGDTCFSACLGGKRGKKNIRDEYEYAGVPIEVLEK